MNHYLDAYSANPPALREDPTRADPASRRGPGTDAVEVMCMFDAGDGEKARKCKAMARGAQQQVSPHPLLLFVPLIGISPHCYTPSMLYKAK